ncbi:unnamed protein product [Symbiodinium sp. CCMP2592]|nr:unnamed protein product [Symbiodinium sp. CCMP2592]
MSILTSSWKRFFSVLGMPSVPDRTFGKSGVSWCDNSARDLVVKGRGYGFAATMHPSGLPPATFCHELHFLGMSRLLSTAFPICRQFCLGLAISCVCNKISTLPEL